MQRGGVGEAEQHFLSVSHVALPCEFGEVDEQGLTDTCPPELRLNVEVLQIDAGLAEEGRVVVKEEREGGWGSRLRIRAVPRRTYSPRRASPGAPLL